MATNYNLEEQEQIANLKHVWERWGLMASVLVLAVIVAVAGYFGYQYWQVRQASQAAVFLEQLRIASAQDQAEMVGDTLRTLHSSYGRTAQASQGSLIAGAFYVQHQQWEPAEQAFSWVESNARDPGFKALGALNKSSVQLQQGHFDAALATLNDFNFPFEFRGLRDDRRGDILQKDGRTAEAIQAYNAAFDAFEPYNSYRNVVQAKLAALGQTPALLEQAGA